MTRTSTTYTALANYVVNVNFTITNTNGQFTAHF
jgi:hypothetical protein